MLIKRQNVYCSRHQYSKGYVVDYVVLLMQINAQNEVSDFTEAQ